MDELPFKIVRMHGAKDEVIARVENLLICKAAFEKALFVYPDAHLEMRQGARIILKSKEGPPPTKLGRVLINAQIGGPLSGVI